MANNKNKDTKKKQVKEEVETVETKKLGKRGIITIILASVALVGITLGIIFGVTACRNKKKPFDFNTSDLSKYLSVATDYYKNYNVDINIPEITDDDVKEEIIKVLCKNKIRPDKAPITKFDVEISAGDVAAIYYRGYTEENGIKKYFDGGCNFGESDPSKIELEIGSGSFVPGFESGLIGKNQKDFANLTRKTSGKVDINDSLISLTYSVARADGTSERSKTVIIDLNDPTLDERWGEGFAAYLRDNKEIGSYFATANGKADPPFIVETVIEGKEGEDAYTNMFINSACSISEGNVLTVEARFPNDYKSEDLRGKTGYFEVYIQGVRDYKTPELNDAFVTDTLKISADELAKYDGATLVDKYQAKIKADLNASRDSEIERIVENSFWEQILAATTFYQLPESEVLENYNAAVAEMKAIFDSGYSTYYNNDFDMFARAYLELSTSADWTATVRKDAENAAKRRLVFYYLVRNNAELMPDDAKYNEIYEMIFNTYLDEYLAENKITENSSNYEQQLALAKEAVKNMYAEEYWREFVIYEYAIEKIMAGANLV